MKTDKIIADVTRQLIDEGKLIEAGFASYVHFVLPSNALPVQIAETRMAFFAGAQHLLGSIMSALDPGEDETDGDLRRMGQIEAELNKFGDELKLRIERTKGSA